jgi:major intracellular serine protease
MFMVKLQKVQIIYLVVGEVAPVLAILFLGGISMENTIRLIPFKVEEKLDNVKEIPEGVNMVQAPEIWKEGIKGKDVVIAVIDTGCDRNHPDLKDRIIGGRNFTTDDNGDVDNYSDYNGHGTHVAGTIAATENGQGVVGVAPEAKLLILKVLANDPNNPGSATGKYEWIVNAINYAVDQKVDIISMSLGGPSDVPELHQAVKRAVENNILVVCAAGNEGDGNERTEELSYPAAYNEVISVGAVSLDGQISRFTNSNKEIDVVAPGEKILSTIPGGKFAVFSGTSMATPHVSGALALIKQLSEKEFGRKLTEPELYAQLIKRTMPLGFPKALEGNGLVYLTAPNLLSEHDKRTQVSSI